jgi:hypothetical protein
MSVSAKRRRRPAAHNRVIPSNQFGTLFVGHHFFRPRHGHECEWLLWRMRTIWQKAQQIFSTAIVGSQFGRSPGLRPSEAPQKLSDGEKLFSNSLPLPRSLHPSQRSHAIHVLDSRRTGDSSSEQTWSDSSADSLRLPISKFVLQHPGPCRYFSRSVTQPSRVDPKPREDSDVPRGLELQISCGSISRIGLQKEQCRTSILFVRQ